MDHPMYQLQALFVIILQDCQLTNPERLWDELKNHIRDDLAYRIHQVHKWGIQNPTDEDVWNYGLYLIESELLCTTGNALSYYKSMPSLQHQWTQLRGNQLIVEQRDYDQKEQSQLAVELWREAEKVCCTLYQSVLVMAPCWDSSLQEICN